MAESTADKAQSTGESIWEIGSGLLDKAKVIPGVGEAINGLTAAYHTGAAVYDGVTGDRDGAVNHGTQAAYSALGLIPGVSEVAGIANLAVGTACGAGKIGAAATGQDVSKMPTGLGDMLGTAAVDLVNGVFGKDDTNWIANGNTPQGTRKGEVGAGVGAMGAVIGGIAGPLGAAAGGYLGNELGKYLGGDGPTSGAPQPAAPAAAPAPAPPLSPYEQRQRDIANQANKDAAAINEGNQAKGDAAYQKAMAEWQAKAKADPENHNHTPMPSRLNYPPYR